MIKAILFVLGFILLAVAIGIAIWLGIVYAKSKEAIHDDQREIENELRQIRSKYQDKVWRLNSNSPKFAEEKAKLEIEMREEQEAFVNAHKAPRAKGLSAFLSTAVLALGLLGFVIVVPGSFHQIEAGSVAVVKELGKITDVRTPGTYFDLYMTRHYEIYDATVQQVEIKTAAYSHDAQTMDLELYLQYQIQLDKLVIKDENGNIKQSEGIAGKYVTLSSLQARIQTQTIEKTKAVMSAEHFYDPSDPEYGTSADFAMRGEEIIRHRAEVSTKVSEVVRQAIGEDYYVTVQDVVLTNIDFTDEFERAVEAKVIAEQEKIAAITRAEAAYEAAKIAAQQKIVEAQGDAEALKIQAQAAAEAAMYPIISLARSLGYTVAETYLYSVNGLETEFGTKQVEVLEGENTVIYLGTKYVIDLTTGPGEDKFKSLVEDYLAYLEYLKVWNGELPDVVAGDDALSIIVPGGN